MVVARGRSNALVVLGALFGVFACTPRRAPLPSTVRRIAVLPPCDPTGAPLETSVPAYGAPVQGLGEILASAARVEIAQHGFQVADPGLVEIATGGNVPVSAASAAAILASAKFDATAVFIRVRRWEFGYPTLRTNEILAALDVMLVDPSTSRVVWEIRRPLKPVPLRGELIGSQADVVAAQEVMHEVFASLGLGLPGD